MLFVKSGGVLLARLPIVPGAEEHVDVPLPDDDVRLRAAARLAAFREDMVDLVARRNIFMARVRQEIEEKNFDQARQLLESLDELPGRTQFNQTLEREAQLHRTTTCRCSGGSTNYLPRRERRSASFSIPRPISELHEELREAQDFRQEVTKRGRQEDELSRVRSRFRRFQLH